MRLAIGAGLRSCEPLGRFHEKAYFVKADVAAEARSIKTIRLAPLPSALGMSR
jgi:hypothetical protein